MPKNPQKIIKAATTGVRLKNYSIQDLATAHNESGDTGLDLAAWNQHLDKVSGGITAAQLSQFQNKKNQTPLHVAARRGNLRQITGGVTAEQLIAAKDAHGETALECAARSGCLKVGQVKGGVTLAHLVQENNGRALRRAIHGHFLDQVKGGVSAAQVLQFGGVREIEFIIRARILHQLQGGMTFAELKSITFPGQLQPDALSLLNWLIKTEGNSDESVHRTMNFLIGCPEAVQMLEIGRPEHVRALQLALQQSQNVGAFVTPNWIAVML